MIGDVNLFFKEIKFPLEEAEKTLVDNHNNQDFEAEAEVMLAGQSTVLNFCVTEKCDGPSG